jgi:hypothetical protein
MRERAQALLKQTANKALERIPVELSRDELQLAAESQFPLRVDGLVNLVIDEPYVRLDRDGDRLGLELSIWAEIMGKTTSPSRWLLDGHVSYDRNTGEFFLHKPDLRLLDARTLANTFGAPEQIRKFMLREMLGGLLSDWPLYTLKVSDSRQALARRFLHSITIRNSKLVIFLHIE